MRLRTHLLLFSLCILCDSVAPSFVFADESPSPHFLLEAAGRDPVTGPILSLGEAWSARLGGREEARVAGGDVIALRRAGLAMPALPDKRCVLLGNGDALPFSRLKLADERFDLTPRFGGGEELRVGVSQVSLIWLTCPDGERHPDKLRRDLAAGERTRDRVLLRNGDSLEGMLASMDDRVVRLEIDKRKLEVALDKIAAVAANTELASRRRPKGPYGRLVLTNGCRLSLASATCDGESLACKTLFGAAVRVAVTDIAALYVLQGRAVYLSDLKPSKIEQTPYLDVAAPPATASSAKGRDLRVGGGTYYKGLGMHAACRMTYDLAGGYQRFEALVGLDKATGAEGSARVQVLVDGKPQRLGSSGDLTRRSGPLAVRVDVSGAKQLTLVTDFGDRGDVQADVDWVDARLIKN
jgi:hypothetical protein